MKIKDVKVFPISPQEMFYQSYPSGSAVLVKIEADDGTYGWGEAVANNYYTFEGIRAIAEGIEHRKKLLIGEDPLEIRTLWEKLYHTSERGRGLTVHGISAIDIALEDLAGKALGVPVYKLLGGKFHDKMRLYASITPDWTSVDTLVADVTRQVDKGFNAIKFGTPEPHRFEELIVALGRIKDQVPTGTDLMIDGPFTLNSSEAIRWGRRFEEFKLLWWEEPLKRDDLVGYKKVADALDMPISSGQHRTTRYEFKEIIEEGIIDIVQPDVGDCGGISEFKLIADMAEVWGLRCIPHSWTTLINTVASLHLVAAMRESFILEFRTEPWPCDLEMEKLFTKNPMTIKEGYSNIPEEPGLGIEVDEALLNKYVIGPSR
jgi:L-alanine-DL-glutamate epimerase-like enolase superfamily enzyme